MRLGLFTFFVFFTHIVTAQDFIFGEVAKITGSNNFILRVDDKDFKVFLKDSEPLKSEEAFKYLCDKILNKKVVVVDVKTKRNDELTGSVLYNCKSYDQIKYEEIPCSEANVLNVEMFRSNLLRYTGDNKFLKKLSDSN